MVGRKREPLLGPFLPSLQRLSLNCYREDSVSWASSFLAFWKCMFWEWFNVSGAVMLKEGVGAILSCIFFWDSLTKSALEAISHPSLRRLGNCFSFVFFKVSITPFLLVFSVLRLLKRNGMYHNLLWDLTAWSLFQTHQGKATILVKKKKKKSPNLQHG